MRILTVQLGQNTLLDAEDGVNRINRKLLGWSNYFSLGPVSKAYRAVDQHAARRLRQWLCRKHKVRAGKIKRFPDKYLYDKLGLTCLASQTRNFSWAIS